DEPDVFYSDGNPNTVDGYIRVDGDTVAYTHVQGGRVFLAPSGELSLKRSHRPGALVYDGRSKWICEYPYFQGQPNLRPFRSIYEIKSIAHGNSSLSIRPDEFARIERFITVHSG